MGNDGKAGDFRELIQKVREGSPEAFHQVIYQYGRHVYRAVRRRLNNRLRSKFDSGDFVQAVWVSFFQQRHQLASFAEPGDLVRFLVQVASHKVFDEHRRRLQRRRYNLNREDPMSDSEQRETLLGNLPTPSGCLIADEQMEFLARDQRKTHRQILELRSMGATFAEIASRIGVSEKTIQRVLQRLSRRIVP